MLSLDPALISATDAIDLHIHTLASDGTWTLEETLERCAKAGLQAAAITDHDTLGRGHEAKTLGERFGILGIPGVEISARDQDHTVHLLGYFLEGPLEKLQAALAALRESRKVRNRKILERLRDLKIQITEEDLDVIAGTSVRGRTHIAQLLLNRGAVRSITAAFDRFLGRKGAAYFSKEEIPVREAIELLHGAGAVASLAHPMRLRWDRPSFEDTVKEWAGWGLDALEVYYATHHAADVKYLEALTEQCGLLRTGGTDFHGDYKPDVHVGKGFGNLRVSGSLMGPLAARKEAIMKGLL